MTESDLISLARAEIPEISTTDSLSDASLVIFLNLAATEFVKRANALPTYSNFNLVLDLVDYPLSTYITTFGKIRKEGLWIYNAVSTKWIQLDAVTTPWLNTHYPDWLNTSSGLSQRYSLDGANIILHPKASATYAGTNYLRLFHFARSVNMTSTTHYPFSGSTTQYPHLANYEEYLIEYVRYKVKKMLKKNADAEEAKQTFFALCLEAKTELTYRPDLIASPNMTTEGAGGINIARRGFQR